MRIVAMATVLIFSSAVLAGASIRLGFEKGEVGEMPPGFKAAVTGKGATESVWKLVTDKTLRGGKLALHQTSKNPSSAFNLCIADYGKFKEVDCGVMIKPVAGDKDQGGGILWRAKDKDNFYVVRYNPLEGNVWLYKTVDGVRSSIQKVEVKAGDDPWQFLAVVHSGNLIKCFFNGMKVIETTDDTFTEAGYVGLWTKADAQTYFSNFQMVGKPE